MRVGWWLIGFAVLASLAGGLWVVVFRPPSCLFKTSNFLKRWMRKALELGFVRSYERFGRAIAWVTPLAERGGGGGAAEQQNAVVLDGTWANASERVSLLSTMIIHHDVRDKVVALHVETLDDGRFKLLTLKSC